MIKFFVFGHIFQVFQNTSSVRGRKPLWTVAPQLWLPGMRFVLWGALWRQPFQLQECPVWQGVVLVAKSITQLAVHITPHATSTKSSF